MTLRYLCIAALLSFPQLAGAQGDPGDAGVAALRANWKGVIDNITKAAEELSDADYAYRPIGTVRTFGQLIGHIAGSQHLMCAAALGEPQPAEDAVEKAATTKADLVKALHESTAHCDKAYQLPASSISAPTELFGERSTRVGALALNAVHDGEHYGNIVTYMRMKGLVPPSSRR
ncbi:MAG: DinB family protein [Gemmatimonadaceae bacterium]